MIEGDGDASGHDPYTEALNAKRLNKRIAAVTNRAPKPVPIHRADGTMLLRGRRRVDRCKNAADRRSGERRVQTGPHAW